ncbi:MAG: hypothetical protein J1F20_00940 [Muribaculaceae bacterium]|nr:hypothetical protein [Muribaculaceae bacterium]
MTHNTDIDALQQSRLYLARQALSYSEALVTEILQTHTTLNELISHRSQNVNRLILQPDDQQLMRTILSDSVEYDKTYEQQRLLMIRFAKHFNIAIQATALTLIDAINNEDNMLFARGRNRILKACDILKALDQVNVTGIRPDILVDLYTRLRDYRISIRYRTLRLPIMQIINHG